jgi:hypothetical protein
MPKGKHNIRPCKCDGKASIKNNGLYFVSCDICGAEMLQRVITEQTMIHCPFQKDCDKKGCDGCDSANKIFKELKSRLEVK